MLSLAAADDRTPQTTIKEKDISELHNWVNYEEVTACPGQLYQIRFHAERQYLTVYE